MKNCCIMQMKYATVLLFLSDFMDYSQNLEIIFLYIFHKSTCYFNGFALKFTYKW